jgi:hypothetical protein
MIAIFRNRRVLKVIIAYVIVAHLAQLSGVNDLYALTSGPTTPEVSSFTPVGTSELVNVATGDFSYNIPLLDVGGYPINISYNSGMGMEDEASVVGFGWNLNVGAINRSMRGLPDEYMGDMVEKEFNMRPNNTIGISLGFKAELAGIEKGDKFHKLQEALSDAGMEVSGSLSWGVRANNYTGLAAELGINPTISAMSSLVLSPNAGLGLNYSTQGGFDITTSYGVQAELLKFSEEHTGLSLSLSKSTHYNTRSGLTGRTLSGGLSTSYYANFKKQKLKTMHSTSLRSVSRHTSFSPTYTPKIDIPSSLTSANVEFSVGSEVKALHPSASFTGYISSQKYRLEQEKAPAYGFLNLHKGVPKLKKENIDEEEIQAGFEYELDRALLDYNREKESAPLIPVEEKDGDLWGTTNMPLPQLTYDFYQVNSQGISGQFRPYRGEIGSVHNPVTASSSSSLSLGGSQTEVANNASTPSSGAEAGPGDVLRLGVNIGWNSNLNRSGYWLNRKGMLEKTQFLSPGDDGIDKPSTYEPAYFKPVGEMSVETDPSLYLDLKENKAVRPLLQDDPNQLYFHTALNKLVDNNKTEYDGPQDYVRNTRSRRNTVFSYLNGEEAQTAGLDASLVSYPINEPYYQYTSSDPNNNPPAITRGDDPENDVYYSLSRASADRPSHHPSEIHVRDASGMKHVFGIPAMNYKHYDATFATADRHVPNEEEGLVNYLPGVDNSTNNTHGLDHYYSKTKLPPYAYAYLLTGMLSADYVDVTGDGISDDDLGTAYKFNYSRIHHDFKWRTPFEINKASHNEGYEAKGLVKDNNDPDGYKDGSYADDKGMYSYGEKEVWLIHSIETKGEYGFVAEFTYSDQNGGLGVLGEDGGIYPFRRLKKLDKISLYSKKDRLENDTTATPIKVVHFAYDDNYSLYQGLPNHVSSLGKLTLKRVHFTYGKSNRARLNAYQFSYIGEGAAGTTENPNYKFNAQNGWGTYRNNPQPSPSTRRTDMYTWEFPYVIDSTIDARVSACKLSEIKLPSGGVLSIEYESHDYAYVQDKKAMQMMKIAGVGNAVSDYPGIVHGGNPDDPDRTNGVLFKKENAFDYTLNNHLFFDLPIALQGPNFDEEFKRRYLDDMIFPSGDKRALLYINARVAVNPNGKTRKFEQIGNYYELEDAGVVPGFDDKAWVRLKAVNRRDKDNSRDFWTNPITANTWQFVRNGLDELIFPSSNTFLTSNSLPGVDMLVSFAANMTVLISGYNRLLASKGVGDEIILSRSWARFYAPLGTRKGGSGARVKKIVLNDNYQAMINELPGLVWNTNGSSSTDQLYENEIYGQQYEYTITEDRGIGIGKETFSSGVAENLPGTIRNENPLVQPKFFLQENRQHRDNQFLMEYPVGEQLMPSPAVIYRKVTVRSLEKDGITCNATGFVTHEHYSAKEFPIQFNETPMQTIRTEEWDFGLFETASTDYYTVSQGYAIIRNDMHGKPKKVSVYGQDPETPLTWQEYVYRTKDGKLYNKNVPVVLPNGVRTTAQIGIEMEAVIDENESLSETTSDDFGLNLDFTSPFIPIPTGWPSPAYEKTRMRSIVLSKLIFQFGILDKVIAYDNGATISTQNMAWDAETGGVLLTLVDNEFEDSRYAFSYPARWAYDELGPAYKNQDISWSPDDEAIGGILINPPAASSINASYSNLAPISDQFETGQNYSDYFSKGDKLYFIKAKKSLERLLYAQDCHFYEGRRNRRRDMRGVAWVTDVKPNSITVVDMKGNFLAIGDYSEYFKFIKIIESGRENTIGTSMAAMTTTEDPFDITDHLNPQSEVLDASAIEYAENGLAICGPMIKYDACDGCDNPSIAALQFLDLLRNRLTMGEFITSTDVPVTDEIAPEVNGVRVLNELGIALGVSPLPGSCGHTDCEIFYRAEPTYSPTDPTCVKGLKVYFSEECNGGARQHVAGCQNGFDMNFDFNFPDGDLFCVRHVSDLESISSPAQATPPECPPSGEFQIVANIGYCDDELLDEEVLISGIACFNIADNCSNFKSDTACVGFGDKINPYVAGLKGNWHPRRSYGYITARTGPTLQYPNPGSNPDPVNVGTDIKNDGAYLNYNPFWAYNSTTQQWETDKTNWQWASEVTKFLPYNFDIENKSPLGTDIDVYSSAVYGYDYKLPVAVAGNAEYHQVTSVDFESESDVASLCRARFLIGNGEEAPILVSSNAHTGEQSLFVDVNDNIKAFAPMRPEAISCSTGNCDPLLNRLRECDCLDNFSPSPDKYHISVWVKSGSYDDGTAVLPAEYDHIALEIFLNGGAPTNGIIEERSKIIDGWMQLTYQFEILDTDANFASPGTYNVFELRFKNSSSNVAAYFDDLRIHPEDASMVSYVYDPVALRLVAQGDERNYYTIYSYRPDGGMTGVMRETERGKQSLNYNEANAAKINP